MMPRRCVQVRHADRGRGGGKARQERDGHGPHQQEHRHQRRARRRRHGVRGGDTPPPLHRPASRPLRACHVLSRLLPPTPRCYLSRRHRPARCCRPAVDAPADRAPQAMQAALQRKFEEAQKEKAAANQKEDFSDMVAQVTALPRSNPSTAALPPSPPHTHPPPCGAFVSNSLLRQLLRVRFRPYRRVRRWRRSGRRRRTRRARTRSSRTSSEDKGSELIENLRR